MLKENKLIRDKIKDFRLLTESVSRDVIIDAVNDRHVLKIYYAGDETTNRGWRTIEPYAVGTHRSTGNIVVRAWQQAGATDTPYDSSRNKGIKSAPKGAWRMFRLDGITSAYDFPNKKFAKDGVRRGYRKDGEDKDMSTVIAAVVAGSDDMAIDLQGISSYTEPDVIKTKLSKFDPQAEKFKSFYDSTKNSEEDIKRKINDLYTMVKQNKENPSNYLVTNKDGKLWYTKKSNQGKFQADEIVGDLNVLFRKYFQPNQFKIDQQFIDKSRKDFEDNMRKAIQT